jgi:hypothetical protein
MHLTNHPIDREELMAFLDGELSADRAGATASHLADCEECQALAADFRGLSQRLTNWPVEQSSPALTSNVIAGLDRYSSQPRRRFAFLARWQTWAWAGSVAGAVGVGTVVILLRPISQQRAISQVSFAVAQNRGTVAQIRDSNVRTMVEMVRAKNPLIVRAAQLTIAVKDFEKTRATVDEMLKRRGGYLGQSNVSSPDDVGRVFEATLRVPSDQLEAAMAEIRALGRVESESQNGEEITQQYVDLEARLSNARNSERRLADLLRDRTGKLADVLAVEKEIERVRAEIERMEAERKNFANRVDFATLNVKLIDEYRAGLQMPGSVSFRLRNAAIDGYRTMTESVTATALFLLACGPSVVFWVVVLFFPVRFIWRRFGRRLLNSL